MSAMKLIRIAVATLLVFLPCTLATLLTLPFYYWAKWTTEHWAWAKEAGPTWCDFIERHFPEAMIDD